MHLTLEISEVSTRIPTIQMGEPRPREQNLPCSRSLRAELSCLLTTGTTDIGPDHSLWSAGGWVCPGHCRVLSSLHPLGANRMSPKSCQSKMSPAHAKCPPEAESPWWSTPG